MRILVVDDHPIFCEGLASLLSHINGIEVVGMAHSGKEALEKIQTLIPDIILLDIEMKDIDGIKTTKIIKGKWPNISIIILTIHCDEHFICDSIEAGADAYLLKEQSSSILLKAIESVGKGQVLLDITSAKKVINEIKRYSNGVFEKTEGKDSFSKREIDVIRLLAKGHTNKEIGGELNLSEHTIRNHLVRIFNKLDCTTRSQVIAEALQKKLI